MKLNTISIIILAAAVSHPLGVAGQSDSVLPASGSYGVSFSLPSGGGASFGLRKMLSPTTNAGLEIQFGFAWHDQDVPSAPRPARTSFTLGVSPDVRLYRGSARPVVPFLELGATFTYNNGPAGAWGLDNAVEVGLGVGDIDRAGKSMWATVQVPRTT